MAELNLDKTETALLMADQRKPWTSWVTQSLSGLLRLRWWHWGRPVPKDSRAPVSLGN